MFQVLFAIHQYLFNRLRHFRRKHKSWRRLCVPPLHCRDRWRSVKCVVQFHRVKLRRVVRKLLPRGNPLRVTRPIPPFRRERTRPNPQFRRILFPLDRSFDNSCGGPAPSTQYGLGLCCHQTRRWQADGTRESTGRRQRIRALYEPANYPRRYLLNARQFFKTGLKSARPRAKRHAPPIISAVWLASEVERPAWSSAAPPKMHRQAKNAPSWFSNQFAPSGEYFLIESCKTRILRPALQTRMPHPFVFAS
jgi:hypothetical protein